jgi:hypothetical protein
MKVENNVDVTSEEDCIDMKSDGAYTLSPFSIETPEPEVSVIFRCVCGGCSCMCHFEPAFLK